MRFETEAGLIYTYNNFWQSQL